MPVKPTRTQVLLGPGIKITHANRASDRLRLVGLSAGYARPDADNSALQLALWLRVRERSLRPCSRRPRLAPQSPNHRRRDRQMATATIAEMEARWTSIPPARRRAPIMDHAGGPGRHRRFRTMVRRLGPQAPSTSEVFGQAPASGSIPPSTVELVRTTIEVAESQIDSRMPARPAHPACGDRPVQPGGCLFGSRDRCARAAELRGAWTSGWKRWSSTPCYVGRPTRPCCHGRRLWAGIRPPALWSSWTAWQLEPAQALNPHPA